MSTIASLNIAIKADASQAKKELKDSAKAVSDFGSLALDGVKYLAATAVAAAAGMAYLVHKSMEEVNTLGNLADKLGIASSQLSSIEYAARNSGVELTTFTAAMLKMSSTLGRAIDGEGTARKHFAELGLTMEELVKMTPDEQFRAIATQISKLPSPAARAAAALEIFGKRGEEMAKLLGMGGEGISKLQSEADKLGITLSGIEVNEIMNARKELNNVFDVVKAFWNHLTAELSPAIEDVSKRILQWVDEIGGVGKISEFVFGLMKDGIHLVVNEWHDLMANCSFGPCGY